MSITASFTDDIVRQNWERHPIRLLGAGLVMYGEHLMHGVIWRIAHMSLPTMIIVISPMIFTILSVLFAGLVAWLAFWMAGLFHFLTPINLALASTIFLGMMVFAWRLADQIGVIWLFRSLSFAHRLASENESDLRVRLRSHAQAIIRLEAHNPANEILLVGHSNGSFVMAMLAAELRRQRAFGAIASRLSILSLGQSLSLLAIQPRALSFRRDLEELARGLPLPWRDISSIDDFMSFRGVNPYLSCGLSAPYPPYPVVELISLAQRQGLTSLWQVIKGQLGLHFEYLATAPPECRGGFDYLELVLEPVLTPELTRPQPP